MKLVYACLLGVGSFMLGITIASQLSYEPEINQTSLGYELEKAQIIAAENRF